jgi:type VI secretion system protein ImpA
MRITALSALAAPGILLALQKSPLAQLRGLGTVSMSDVRAAASGSSASSGDSVVSTATVEAIFQGVEFASLEATLLAVQRCIDGVAVIDDVFVTHTGSRGPDLSTLLQLLREIRNILRPRLNARQPVKEVDAPAPLEDASVANAVGNNMRSHSFGALTGEIQSREDVLSAIDKICAYYSRSEPASPLPLLLERCRRLVSSSFLEIIQELAPDCVAQVNSIAGRKPE